MTHAKPDLQSLADESLEAFWKVIVQHFPQAESGNLSPLTTTRLQDAAEAAIKEWIGANVPETDEVEGIAMEAIETETVEHDGHTYRIAIYPDGDTPNPLDDWSEMGTILSLGCRHGTFDPDGVADAIEGNPDAVPLSYFEHGRCLWCVAGELPATARCPWDSVGFAGVWLPDAETLASARNYGGRTRRHFMRKRARQACDVYTQWCNAEVYGYQVERVLACDACGGEATEFVDSCWGFYGWADCLAEARAAVAARTEPESPLDDDGSHPKIVSYDTKRPTP